jgi:hypothetical protein
VDLLWCDTFLSARFSHSSPRFRGSVCSAPGRWSDPQHRGADTMTFHILEPHSTASVVGPRFASGFGAVSVNWFRGGQKPHLLDPSENGRTTACTVVLTLWSGRRDSNSRPTAWQLAGGRRQNTVFYRSLAPSDKCSGIYEGRPGATWDDRYGRNCSICCTNCSACKSPRQVFRKSWGYYERVGHVG